SSMTMKYAMENSSSASSNNDSSSRTTPREDKYERSPKPPPRDWLTGDDDDQSTTSIKQQNTRGSAILRDTPAKRASVVLPKEFRCPSPKAATHDTTPLFTPKELPPADDQKEHEESPTVSRFKSYFPAIDTVAANDAATKARENGGANEGLTDNWSPIA